MFSPPDPIRVYRPTTVVDWRPKVVDRGAVTSTRDASGAWIAIAGLDHYAYNLWTHDHRRRITDGIR